MNVVPFIADPLRSHGEEFHRPEAAGDGLDAVQRFTIVLVGGFSQLCLASFIEPLRIANKAAGKTIFEWRLLSETGNSVQAATGECLSVQGDISTITSAQLMNSDFGALVVCSGDDWQPRPCLLLTRLLRSARRNSTPIYTLGSAAWMMAQLGLPNELRCTIHWRQKAAFSETFAHLDVSDQLFVSDGNLTTCAGEFAAFDLIIELIRRRCGEALVRTVCSHLLADNWRRGTQPQSAPLGLKYACANEKLILAIRLMEANLEETLRLDTLAAEVNLSRRQLERLFEQYLSQSPSNYYRKLRLGKARQLLEYTNQPVFMISVACGFTSAAHFSKCFRAEFRCSPNSIRKQARLPRY